MISRRELFKLGGLTAMAVASTGKLRASSSGVACFQDKKLEAVLKNLMPLEVRDYEERLERAYQLMAENRLPAFFIEPGPSLQYFTGVAWWRSERTFGVILFPGRKPVWVCSKFELERAREMVSIDQEVRTWEENESPFKLIGKTLKDYARAQTLAVEPSTRAFILYGIRKDAPETQLADGSAVSEGCRGIKSEKEISYMEAANRITKLSYREAFKKIEDGMSPEELSRLIREEHSKYGVIGGGSPSFGPNSAFPHGSRQKRDLKAGDVVLVDGGCRVEGYSSDVTRSIVFGKPSDKQKRIWDVVRKAQQAAFKACRPGASCEDVDRAARKVIEEAGFGSGYEYFSHRLGHGIGLEGHEYPYLVQGNKLKIPPGMTFSNEPGIYVYGEFGIRTEDCMVVTGDGARILGGMEAASVEQPFAEE